MRIPTLLVTAALAAAPALLATGCKKDPADAAAEAAIKKLAISELAALLESDKTLAVFDANSDSTRKKYGVVPGAKLLSSSSDYDLGLLPASKADSLVFYCSSTQCSAAEGAAKRAVKSGYSNVSILPEGIKGWSKAGQKTAKPTS